MNAANQFLDIDIFLAEDGFVPILEEMTGSAMPSVEANDVPGQQPAHNCCDRNIPGLQQQMKMVPDQTPGITAGHCCPVYFAMISIGYDYTRFSTCEFASKI